MDRSPRRAASRRRLLLVFVPLLILVFAVVSLRDAAGRRGAATAAHAPLRVVVVENFWGSIARQEGGSRAQVTSIIVNPNADPHAYEPTIGDARAFALAQYVVLNGAGYDSWGQKLLDANPVKGRRVLVVGDYLGIKGGSNPHAWYNPAFVARVAARMSADYATLDPAHRGYFVRQHIAFVGHGLARYNEEVSLLAHRYRGVPVGATESIFEYLAAALHLHLLTPPGFMKALSEGTEPTAGDRVTFEQQITGKKIKVLVFNSQNATPDTLSLENRARAQGIPIVAITETLSPASTSFQSWQVGQLRALQSALAQATSR